jgi:hypothetical protein
MNTELTVLLQSFAMLLQQTLLLWRTRGKLWLPRIALLTSVPLLLTIGWYSGKWDRAISIGIGAPLLVLVLPFWLFTFANLQIQNSPAAAQLVPHLHRRLCQLVLLGWLLVAGSFALLLAISLGHFWHLLGLFLLGLLGYTIAFTTGWGGLTMVALAILLDRPGPGLLDWWWQAGPLQTGAVLLSALIGGALLFLFLLRKGDPRHFQRHANSTRFQKMAIDSNPTTQSWASLTQYSPWLKHLNLHTLLLRWQLSPLAPGQQADPAKRLFTALPPNFHASALAVNLLVALVIIMLFALMPQNENHIGAVLTLNFAAALLVGIAFAMPIGFVWRALSALHQSRREQQLLSLLPHMPGGSALNRRLMQTLLGQFALIWLISLLCGWYVGTLHLMTVVPGLALSFSAFSLPQVLLLLRDHARGTEPGPNFPLWPLCASLLLALGWKLLQMAWHPIGIGWLLAAVGVPTLILCYRRWQRLMAAPGAFPVGRLA